jgi:hypothetical protein
MAKAKVVFHRIVQDTQDYRSFDSSADHMVSTLYFSLDAGGKHFDGLSVEVRQPFGTDFESEPIEVARPVGSYQGPWNHAAFSALCESYYRKAVGATASGIRITGGSNVRMRGNQFVMSYSGEFELPESGAESW